MNRTSKYVRRVSWRPETPDGVKYPFDCCTVPDVWETQAGVECRNCGYDWSEAEP